MILPLIAINPEEMLLEGKKVNKNSARSLHTCC